MTWKTALKNLDISNTVAHGHTGLSVVGRAPGISSFSFSPLELYGAAARCSHLNLINPAIVTVESLMIEAMLAQHVDDSSRDFAILKTADNFKDFVKSYFAGTVAAGIAYLAMINDGYVWSDHFESAGGGNPRAAKSPDFVFSGPSTGVALVETKGSRSATLAAFDKTVRDGYLQQVEPHLGYLIGGVTSTHGYCIGAHLRSVTKAEVRIHHTTGMLTGSGSSGTGEDPDTADLSTLQRHNYATALALVHDPFLGDRLRAAEEPESVIIFYRFEWLGRHWLTRFVPAYYYPPMNFPYHFGREENRFLFFAIEESIASNVLARFLGGSRVGELEQRLDPLPRELISKARSSGTDQAGAIFPDGLALIGHSPKLNGDNWIEWNVNRKCFSPLN